MSHDLYQAERDPSRRNGWQVVRVENGQRLPLPHRFKTEHAAKRRAYEWNVGAERRRNRPVYVGD